MFSMFAKREVPKPVELDSEQRWLVRDKLQVHILSLSQTQLQKRADYHSLDRSRPAVYDITLGEVAGQWFKIKSYTARDIWRHASEFDWLEQLI